MFQDANTSPLADSWEALYSGDTTFFATRLPKREHYRVALTYPRETLFLDIETTGLSHHYDDITLVGWSVNGTYNIYIKGDDPSELANALASSKAIVTFNGSLFDLPFIKNHFPNITFPAIHVDLRFLSRRIGLSGSQKDIEYKIMHTRGNALQEINGKEAILLWHRFKRGDFSSLQKLVNYNHADIEGMKYIFDAIIARLLPEQGFPVASWPDHPFVELSSPIQWNGKTLITDNQRRHIGSYRYNAGPRVCLSTLAQHHRLASFKVVGVDLTGSSRRKSGIAYLQGNKVSTSMLSTDDEIINYISSLNPDVVSIDSPLSLPRGRQGPGDDDPGRGKHGITRECERELRRRGVSVYPCLIPSMQNLTQRGMQIAERLRKSGIPVIESYPGAAQDILDIPRKGASTELLKQGLLEFGLDGHWATTSVTHDELDAITSALVAIFWWSGHFETLGGNDEGQLIVPAVNVTPDTWIRRRVIGLSGKIGSGKTMAAQLLSQAGYHSDRFSNVLHDILVKNNITPTRSSLQQLGAEVHNNPGQVWLCKQLVNRLPPSDKLVIDGLRHPEDHASLVEEFGPGFIHIYLKANEYNREERYSGENSKGETFEAATNHSVEQNIDMVKALAHRRVRNDNGTDVLRKRLSSAISDVRKARVK